MKRIAFHTLGCKLNFSETSTLARRFSENGYKTVRFGDEADIIVINTCSVTGQADHKCRQAIRKAVKTSPDAFVAVTGCFAQLKTEEIAAIPGVSLVAGAGEKFNLPDYIEKYLSGQGIGRVYSSGINHVTRFDSSYSMHERTRSFLKVQDGCDYHCSYCTVPLARGKSRNAPVSELVKQAEIIAAGGVNEIVLSGVNVGDFGKTTGESLLDLLKALDKIEGLSRIRISSIEPNLLSADVIDFVSESRLFVPHFHIPLQSGSDRLLALMRRRYKRDVFKNRVEKAFNVMPDCCIGADVIVGFPEETDDDFEDTFNFISSLDISYLHVFTYSERPDTPAATMPVKVPNRVRTERSSRLLALSDTKKQEFYSRFMGKTFKVLWEQKEKGDIITGFTENYIKVQAPFNVDLLGRTTVVKLKKITGSGTVDSEAV